MTRKRTAVGVWVGKLGCLLVSLTALLGLGWLLVKVIKGLMGEF